VSGCSCGTRATRRATPPRPETKLELVARRLAGITNSAFALRDCRSDGGTRDRSASRPWHDRSAHPLELSGGRRQRFTKAGELHPCGRAGRPRSAGDVEAFDGVAVAEGPLPKAWLPPPAVDVFAASHRCSSSQSRSAATARHQRPPTRLWLVRSERLTPGRGDACFRARKDERAAGANENPAGAASAEGRRCRRPWTATGGCAPWSVGRCRVRPLAATQGLTEWPSTSSASSRSHGRARPSPPMPPTPTTRPRGTRTSKRSNGRHRGRSQWPGQRVRRME
jgi:hypothetical protein